MITIDKTYRALNFVCYATILTLPLDFLFIAKNTRSLTPTLSLASALLAFLAFGTYHPQTRQFLFRLIDKYSHANHFVIRSLVPITCSAIAFTIAFVQIATIIELTPLLLILNSWIIIATAISTYHDFFSVKKTGGSPGRTVSRDRAVLYQKLAVRYLPLLFLRLTSQSVLIDLASTNSSTLFLLLLVAAFALTMLAILPTKKDLIQNCVHCQTTSFRCHDDSRICPTCEAREERRLLATTFRPMKIA